MSGEKIGRYEISREIGSGTNAVVYLAEDGTETVAIKVLHRNISREPLVRERFRREVEIARTLTHPGIVAVYDIIHGSEQDAAVMEYCEGGSLADHRPETPAEWIRIAREVAEALAFAHAHGIIHRDVKPGNILFGGPKPGTGKIKLGDFGSAHVKNLIGITTSSMFIGTPQYIPPESLTGVPADPRWDLYSLGAVLYQLATGVVHTDMNLRSLFRQKSAVTPPYEINTEVPRWFGDLILRLLGPLEHRPAGARAFLDLLDSRESSCAEKVMQCLYCLSPMPIDSPVCLSCGKPGIKVEYYTGPDAETIVLHKLVEHVDVIDRFYAIARAISGDPGLTFKFITEDARMYSRKERKDSIRLPVRLIENLSPDAVTGLLDILKGTKKSEIKFTRHPVKKAARSVKRGPLLTPRQGTGGTVEGAGFLAGAVDAVKKSQPDIISRRTDAATSFRKEIFASSALASYRIIRNCADPVIEREVTELAVKIEAFLGRISLLEQAISSVSPGGIYGDIQRLQVRADSATGAEAESLLRMLGERRQTYERYLEQERLHSILSGRALETVRKLERIVARSAGDAEQIKQELEQIMRELE